MSGRTVALGYVFIRREGTKLHGGGAYKQEHIIVAERALGKPLPAGSVVHHHNQVRDDNANTNLIICQDRQYHNLLHLRMRTVAFGGDPNTHRYCGGCGALKPHSEFGQSYPQCKPCVAIKNKKRSLCPECGNVRRWDKGVTVCEHCELLAYWQERSELFRPPDEPFEIGHIVEGGIE